MAMQQSSTAPHMRPLLPATGSRQPQPPSPKRKRRSVACENCRLKKTKCDGEQPVCGRCQSLNLECDYEIGPSDKSRKSVLQRRLGEAEGERNDLRELLDMIQTQPEEEATEIFRRLRMNRDPLMTLQSLRQAKTLLPNPDPVSQFQGYPQIATLDADSARWSPLKVRARPWTTVAGDGIVSLLLSKFFAWDGAYVLPFIDRNCFIRDMKTGEPGHSEFCSPFLVNAICTLQHYSPAVRRINTVTGQKMQEFFFNEARQYYHLENNLASLATAQGLLVLFLASAFLSRDGAAPVYRMLGYDMFDRLRIEEKMSSATDDQEVNAYSTALWGIYCYENIVANLHNKRPQRRAPTVARTFYISNEQLRDGVENTDIFGQPFTSSSYRPPFTPGILNAACDLATLQHTVVNRNHDVQEQGVQDDLNAHIQQYRSLQDWWDKLPPLLRNEENNTPGTTFLSIHRDVIALFILRPLDPQAQLIGEATSQSLRIVHCQRIISLVEKHFHNNLAGDYSTFFLAGLFHACLTLIPSLSSLVSAELFTRASMLLHRTVVDLPGMRQVLRGVQAVVWGMRKKLPQEARASFENVEQPENAVEVIHEWGFPLLEYLQSEPDAGVKDLKGLRGGLGEMIEMWMKPKERVSEKRKQTDDS